MGGEACRGPPKRGCLAAAKPPCTPAGLPSAPSCPGKTAALPASQPASSPFNTRPHLAPWPPPCHPCPARSAESFHRDFFKNWAAGVPPEKCSRGTEGHNTASIGGFVMLPPVILGSLPRGVEAAKAAALQHLALTHESAKLAKFAGVRAGRARGPSRGSASASPWVGTAVGGRCMQARPWPSDFAPLSQHSSPTRPRPLCPAPPAGLCAAAGGGGGRARPARGGARSGVSGGPGRGPCAAAWLLRRRGSAPGLWQCLLHHRFLPQVCVGAGWAGAGARACIVRIYFLCVWAYRAPTPEALRTAPTPVRSAAGALLVFFVLEPQTFKQIVFLSFTLKQIVFLGPA